MYKYIASSVYSNYDLFMKFDELINDFKKLKLPLGEYVIVSSGSLAARGIRDVQDLDILVSDKLWNQLAEKYEVEKTEDGLNRINLNNDDFEILGKGSWFSDSTISPIDETIKSADIIDRIAYMNLDLLKKFKQKFGREKDLKDIELIDQYLVTNQR